MSNWEDLSEEEKDKIVALIQENYPEFFLKIIDIVTPLTEAIMPIIEIITGVFKQIIEYLMQKIPPEILEEMLKKYESK